MACRVSTKGAFKNKGYPCPSEFVIPLNPLKGTFSQDDEHFTALTPPLGGRGVFSCRIINVTILNCRITNSTGRNWGRPAAFPVRRLKSTVNKRSSHAGLCRSRKWNKLSKNKVHQPVSLFRYNSLTKRHGYFIINLMVAPDTHQGILRCYIQIKSLFT